MEPSIQLGSHASGAEGRNPLPHAARDQRTAGPVPFLTSPHPQVLLGRAGARSQRQTGTAAVASVASVTRTGTQRPFPHGDSAPRTHPAGGRQARSRAGAGPRDVAAGRKREAGLPRWVPREETLPGGQKETRRYSSLVPVCVPTGAPRWVQQQMNSDKNSEATSCTSAGQRNHDKLSFLLQKSTKYPQRHCLSASRMNTHTRFPGKVSKLSQL
ncbi:uncharacterized protein LOC131581002 [Poecile atricapillus]|uniref:uncharacterized protein LOC131581002 n=1 Tax=Poecile atricapillus TaxID=48891 RepID=UPI0027399333|nr:uncharacterized protein LOC131581002 [Poecile atricapillus]